MAAKGKYIVTGDTPQEVRNDINFALQRIAERLDQLEGNLGVSTIASNLEMSGQSIQNVNELSSTSVNSDSVTATDTTSTNATIDSATITTLVSDDFSLVQEKWNDLTADLGGVQGGGSNPPSWANYRDGLYAWSFSAAAEKELFIVFHVNHDYARGTNIYPHVHWSPTTTSTGTVVWGMEWSFAKGFDQEAFGATQTLTIEQEVTTSSQYQHFVAEATDDEAFGSDILETDGLLMVRLYRDATNPADDFPDAVFALTADIHYQVEQIATPNKAPPFF